jgi:cytochrome d ubiquinol oxidase subunit I
VSAATVLAALPLETTQGALGAVEQAYLDQARQLQAISLGFHIILVCFGVAFPAMVLFTEWMGLRTGDPVYRAIAMRWSKVMIVLFAVGVVSGTVLSFELGMLWPNFMATFGEVFGFAFALEGFAFFLEAIFITIYVYGWKRLSPRAHLLSGLPIPIAGVFGALFVISVNGWMNQPTGFTLGADGRVVDVDPVDALLNDALWHTLVHMLLAAIMVSGFLVAGLYAYRRLRGNRDRYGRIAMLIPLTIACLASPVQLIVGDWAARHVAVAQPVKLAAFEGLGETQAQAPFHLFGWYSDGEVTGGIEIPYLLSILAFHDPNAVVTGLDSVPVDDQPPVNVVRYAFEAMIMIGTGLVMLAAWYLLTWWFRRRVPRSRWFLRAVVLAGPLAVVALISGWITTEVGRQPWIVYEVMRTADAVTGASGVPVGLGVMIAVYLALGAGAIWALRLLARRPLPPEAAG